MHRGELVWDFSARPSALGRDYTVRIRYRNAGLPHVVILSPDLNVLADGRAVPHIYSSNPTRLCLYYPGQEEWSPKMAIAETIVPWTYLWLFYFEDWLISNEWKGGGRHPGESDAV